MPDCGPARVSALIIELTNFLQEAKHQELEDEVTIGEIKDASEYAIMRSLIELDGMKIHREVLLQLDRAIPGGIPNEMLAWINPKLRSVSEYHVPNAFDYVKSLRDSDYRRGFEDWFKRRKAER